MTSQSLKFKQITQFGVGAETLFESKESVRASAFKVDFPRVHNGQDIITRLVQAAGAKGLDDSNPTFRFTPEAVNLVRGSSKYRQNWGCPLPLVKGSKQEPLHYDASPIGTDPDYLMFFCPAANCRGNSSGIVHKTASSLSNFYDKNKAGFATISAEINVKELFSKAIQALVMAKTVLISGDDLVPDVAAFKNFLSKKAFTSKSASVLLTAASSAADRPLYYPRDNMSSADISRALISWAFDLVTHYFHQWQSFVDAVNRGDPNTYNLAPQLVDVLQTHGMVCGTVGQYIASINSSSTRKTPVSSKSRSTKVDLWPYMIDGPTVDGVIHPELAIVTCFSKGDDKKPMAYNAIPIKNHSAFIPNKDFINPNFSCSSGNSLVDQMLTAIERRKGKGDDKKLMLISVSEKAKKDADSVPRLFASIKRTSSSSNDSLVSVFTTIGTPTDSSLAKIEEAFRSLMVNQKNNNLAKIVVTFKDSWAHFMSEVERSDLSVEQKNFFKGFSISPSFESQVRATGHNTRVMTLPGVYSSPVAH